MRFIGCKKKLLSDIEALLKEKILIKQESFCDIFSGTATVATHFKNQYRILSNNSLFFSYILQKTYIEGDGKTDFSNLGSIGENVFLYLSDNLLSQEENGYITENYSPSGTSGRMYFTTENARRIDFARCKIEQWLLNNKITNEEYYYLLASLIESVPSIFNITGTYGAYLKTWDKRAFNNLSMKPLNIVDNGQENKVFNEDALDVITHISGDILYIDPPYNSRQYAPNYHVLETISRYDNPELKGVSGMRPYESKKIETFVDMFCGGCNVGINSLCNKVIFNDINTVLTNMFKVFKESSLDELLNAIYDNIKIWNLSMENIDGYNALRKHYNLFRNPVDLFTFSCFSFNYQLRFNNRHGYNNPFGKNRSRYSEVTQKNLIRFVNRLKMIDSEFTNYDFVDFSIETLTREDFVYCDPLYSITIGTYNDGKRGFKGWNEQDDKLLCNFLDNLDKTGIRFAMSNVLFHKGKNNYFLQQWSEKYNVAHLDKDYSNSSYNTKRMKSDEVLIFNY